MDTLGLERVLFPFFKHGVLRTINEVSWCSEDD